MPALETNDTRSHISSAPSSTLPSIEECYRVLKKANSNIVREILRQSSKFYQWQHYPEGDVYDPETYCQYYYHAHDPESSERFKEHGHFHLFIRQTGIPKHIHPTTIAEKWLLPDSKDDDLCHLIAISMDSQGYPLRLFTVNRWVTGETWYSADAIIPLLDLFAIDHAWPSWPTNIWLTQMVKRYKGDIITLLKQRDKTFTQWQLEHPDQNPYEARKLEVLSLMDL